MFTKLRITSAIKTLGKMEVCYPMDIFSVSRQIAETKDSEYSRKLVIEYGNHKNAFVRRCLLTAIRFMGEYTTDSIKLNRDYITRSLSDDNEWVQYDACWIIKDFGFGTDEDMPLVKKMAGDQANFLTDELNSYTPKDAKEHAAKIAAETIHTYKLDD